LRSAYSLKNQADLLQQYVLGAAHHPNFVGTHWFQWSDQPTTGRGGDGENFRIGIVNVTDRPYPILVDAIKSSSIELYKTRVKSQK
jgi:agarase